jgi:hypothetical protein
MRPVRVVDASYLRKERWLERNDMTERGSVGAKRDRRPETGGVASEREELERRLDEALECTFPASDPFDLSPRNRRGAESD